MGKVFSSNFPTYKNSEALRRKCDTVFQIMHTLIHNPRRKTPLHAATAETIHKTCRSKKLINIGIIWAYALSMMTERIDTALVNRIVTEAGEHRVPVAESIKSSSVIHCAMHRISRFSTSLSKGRRRKFSRPLMFDLYPNKTNSYNSRCDTTSKVSTKRAAFRTALDLGYDLQLFEKHSITDHDFIQGLSPENTFYRSFYKTRSDLSRSEGEIWAAIFGQEIAL